MTRWPAVVAAAVVLAAAAPGAEASSHRRALPPNARYIDYLPPEVLLEAPPLNASARATAKGRRSVPVCVVLDQLALLDEPSPEEPDEVLSFAGRYHGLLSVMQLSADVVDEQGRSRREPLPAAVTEAVVAQQAQMHALMARVPAAVSLKKEKRHEEARAEIDAATLYLANSSFTPAERVLAAARDRYCRQT